jgi:hypothetical protein
LRFVQRAKIDNLRWRNEIFAFISVIVCYVNKSFYYKNPLWKACSGKLLSKANCKGLAKRLFPEATKWPDCAENRPLVGLLK